MSDPAPDAPSGQLPLGADDLAARLAGKVIGQPGALDAIVPSIQLHLSGLAPEGRPVGVFLLLGPTGTGKTRTVEALAEVLHGDAKKVLRVDCGEFQSDHEIAKLIGAPPGYIGHQESKPRLTQGALAEVMSLHCDLALVLFDEIEKAAPAMTQLLLGIFDRAELRLGDGSVVDFTDTIIFLTSNLGAREMLGEMAPSLGFGSGGEPDPDELRLKLERVGMNAVRKYFSPEFLNRIDDVVVYQALEANALAAILDQQIAELQQHVHTRLGKSSFEIEVTPDARAFLIERGTSVEYGARELRRAIHRHLTQPLAALVARREVPPGSEVVVDLDEAEGEALRLTVREGSSSGARDIHTVLAVDDNATILRWLTETLSRRGFEVIPAGGIAEARERMIEARPDAVIIDHVLPEGEGVALAREIRETFPDLPILMTSGFELDEEERRFCLEHDIPQLNKPFLSDELLQALDSLRASPPRRRSHGA